MHRVADLLSHKGFDVQSVGPDVTVLRATQLMNHHQIGSLVVMVDGKLTGIFTERDVLRRVVAEELSPAETLISDVMTANPICCSPEDEVDHVAGLMKTRRVRHVPVVDKGGQLLGLVSIGDINAMHASVQEQQLVYLNDYIYGRA